MIPTTDADIDGPAPLFFSHSSFALPTCHADAWQAWLHWKICALGTRIVALCAYHALCIIMCVEVLVVPFALYHVRCTMCAVPFALYHLRRIMRVVSCGAVELTRAGARARDSVSSRRSSQSFGGQAVTCYVFLSSLLLRAVQFPQLWIVVFRSTRTRQRNRIAPRPCAMPIRNCQCAAPAGAAKTRKSACAESASRHGGSVRFDALPAWVLGSADRHRGSGARARAGGLARSPRRRRGAPSTRVRARF